jgi:hypothetical protein
MTVARTRTILWLTAALGAAAGSGALVLAFALPLDGASRPAPRALVAAANENEGPQPPGVPPLASFEPAWSLPLRRPLIDPPAPAVLPAAATQPGRPPNLMVRLIGTIIDGRRPRGVFLVGLAGVEIKTVGERAGGAEILRIDDNAATLSYNGQTFTLRREKTPFDPTGGSVEPPAAKADGPAAEPGS